MLQFELLTPSEKIKEIIRVINSIVIFFFVSLSSYLLEVENKKFELLTQS